MCSAGAASNESLSRCRQQVRAWLAPHKCLLSSKGRASREWLARAAPLGEGAKQVAGRLAGSGGGLGVAPFFCQGRLSPGSREGPRQHERSSASSQHVGTWLWTLAWLGGWVVGWLASRQALALLLGWGGGGQESSSWVKPSKSSR